MCPLPSLNPPRWQDSSKLTQVRGRGDSNTRKMLKSLSPSGSPSSQSPPGPMPLILMQHACVCGGV
eukprot:1060640-Rhodomonas_salina.3